MELEQASATLRDYVRTSFQIPDSDPDFNDDVHLFDYGYVDSFGAVGLLHFVESAFGVEIREADLVAYPLNTIHQITRFAMRRKNGEL
ncbi:MAG: acyl carrier protein [Acidobacteria bacterium]|nr:acyl carrier protein [Acidobacteriota bacterium]